MIVAMPFAETAYALRSGQLDLLAHINDACNHIERTEPLIRALLPEPDRRGRLIAEATLLRESFPDPESRPLFYGMLLGVKDILRVNGFATRAGSQLSAELFIGPEASCVTRLRNAGMLMLGKTVSTEFAYYQPGPTRNPHTIEHTPGGSSSGSAAAVAAGFCPLALGTQTVGSILRPAAFCGVVGFKPSYGRIATDGVIPAAPSLDTVGFFTQDAAGIAEVASVLCDDWQPVSSHTLPVLGVPDGPYLAQASEEGLAAFERQVVLLEQAGYTVRRVPALNDIEDVNVRHNLIFDAEMARVHARWFAEYESLYSGPTASAIRRGQGVSAEELVVAQAGGAALRAELEMLMARYDIDLWISPAAPGPAPQGIETTGNPVMNLLWTHAGMPAITLPAGRAANGLPFGLQAVGAFMADELLVSWAKVLAKMSLN